VIFATEKTEFRESSERERERERETERLVWWWRGLSEIHIFIV
jgi:hypothetical protein